LFQKHRAPFADDSLGVLLRSAKAKAAHNGWSVIADRRQGEEDVFWVELFDFLQSDESFRGWHAIQRLAQKILHGGLAIKLINFRLTPLIACPNKVRHVRKKNCFLRQNPGHRSARNPLGKIPIVPTSVCGNGAHDDKQQNSFHTQRLSGAVARYSMLDAGSNAK
jgi:hypothetical protein